MRYNKKLLKGILGVDTEDMQEYLMHCLPGIDCAAHVDEYQNVVGIKGDIDGAPVLIAHTDTVFDNPAPRVVALDKWLFGIDDAGKQCGIGADDRAGCAAILQLIPHLENVVAVFTSYEEHGAIGASMLDIDPMQSACIVLELDRRNPSKDKYDAIWISNGATLASATCKQNLKSIFLSYGYHYAEGVFTDIGELKRRGLMPSAYNMSIGYMREHTSSEVLYLPAYENALECALDICKSCIGMYYPHEAVNQTWDIPYTWYETKNTRHDKKKRRRDKNYTMDGLQYLDEHYDEITRHRRDDSRYQPCQYCGAYAVLIDDTEYKDVCSECLRLLRPYKNKR